MDIQQLKKDIFKLNIYIERLQLTLDQYYREPMICDISKVKVLRRELNFKRKELSKLRLKLFLMEVYNE